MATLNIGGKRVKVSDDFLSLSPEEQQRTANEIAAQIGAAPMAAPVTPSLADSVDPPAGAKPGSREYADWAAARARAGKALPQVSPAPPEDATRGPLEKIAAFTASAADAVPIAGPTLRKGLEGLRASVQGMTPEEVARETRIITEANPTSSLAGAVTGTVAPFVLASTVPVVSTILGVDVGAPLVANVALGAASQKAISHLDTLARGGDPSAEIPGLGMKPEDIAGIAGAAGPIVGKVVGAGLNKLGETVVDPVVKAFRAATGQGDDAARAAIERTVRADMAAGNILSAADEAAAAAAGQPLINADRFGGATRNLARTAANTDPVAREALSEFVTDRFYTQNARAKDWVARNTGAPTDLYATQQNLAQSAKGVNNAAYKTAYAAPGADNIWTPELEQLMQSANFRSAILSAVKTSNEEAALTGAKAIQNPFVFKANGSYELRPGTQPSLQFWDHVQRALRRRASQLAKSGETDFDAGQVLRARGQLNEVLDAAVPEFNAARGGAARWFGAEDALEAGQKFVVSKPSDIGEATAAFNKFTPAEKKLFATGFASSLLDRIGSTPDTVNVINKVFGSPQARAQIELALGKRAATELEQFVRIENTMQMTKLAVGSKSPNLIQDLLALGVKTGTSAGGIGYGTGAAFGGLDPRNWGSKAWTMAMLGAAGRAGMQSIGKRVDASVMNRIAKLLASDDPKLIQQAVQNASRSDRAAAALQAIESGLSMLVRSASLGAAGDAAMEGTTE
jgi:hypothetical protein